MHFLINFGFNFTFTLIPCKTALSHFFLNCKTLFTLIYKHELQLDVENIKYNYEDNYNT